MQKLLKAKQGICTATPKSGKELASSAKRAHPATALIGLEVIEMLLAHEETIPNHRAEPVEIWKARKFIEEHSSEELSLSKVAKAVNISANYLSEKFKQVTGVNFTEYVARRRFEHACNFLRNPKMRISEIAFAVGFQSLSQFNRVFKKLARKSPSQYRADRIPQRKS